MASGSPGVMDRLTERIDAHVAEDPFQRDEVFLARLLRLMEIFNRYFDSEVVGFERLPETGPMLLVGNHSGGTIVPDTPALLAAWYRERGLDDPLLGLAFDALFALPGIETLMRKIGEIPATHENATRALESGASVLVYPGGDHEAFRPWRDRNVIDFDGRSGFVKLALRSGVPVVPVVAHGGHHTTLVLSRGEKLAQLLGLERFRVGIAPVLFQVPWGISLAMQPGLPLPAKITVELGEPIDWSELGPEAADDPEIVARCYSEVTERMQSTLDRLARECPYPVIERLLRLLPGGGRERGEASSAGDHLSAVEHSDAGAAQPGRAETAA